MHQLGEDGRILVESLEDNGIVVQLIDYTESSGENHRTTSLDGVCYSDIHFRRVILYVWGSPPVVSLLLTSAVLSAEYQCSAVNDTFDTSFLQDSWPSFWRGCISTLVHLVSSTSRLP